MKKELLLTNAIIIFYIIHRITEMVISRENEKWIKENLHGAEVDKSEGIVMKIFHSCWFISLLIESNLKNDLQHSGLALLIYTVLAICMGIRIYSIEKLKKFWTIKIFSMEKQELVTDGLYKYIRHPNYMVVILEFILIPFLFKAYFTMFVFSLLNCYILYKRIRLEERTLSLQSNYADKFLGIKRLIPFIFSLILFTILPLSAKELSYDYKDYDQAKKAESYIKFDGESTKLGFITTAFDGYAKKFKLLYEIKNDHIDSLDVFVVTSSLDTNLNARNEKMVNTILEQEKYSVIHAKILEKILLTNADQVLNMLFTIKEHSVTKPMKVKIEKQGDYYLITGSATLGLQEFGLPDPSIIVAKVKDSFELKFSVKLL